MKIIAIGNQKGGVGKTTTAINFSAGLANKGKKVLLLDMDPQANATSGLGLEPDGEGCMYLPLLRQASLDEKIIETRIKNLSIVPGDIDLSGVEIELARQPDHLTRLSEILKGVGERHNFDYCILDTPPSLGVLMTSSIAASDQVIVTLQCEWFGLVGLTNIMRVIDDIRGAGISQVTLEGILMTMYDGRTNLSRAVVSEVKSVLPDELYEVLIPRAIRLGEAPSHGRTIFEHDNSSVGAKAYRKFVNEFLRREKARAKPSAVSSD